MNKVLFYIVILLHLGIVAVITILGWVFLSLQEGPLSKQHSNIHHIYLICTIFIGSALAVLLFLTIGRRGLAASISLIVLLLVVLYMWRFV